MAPAPALRYVVVTPLRDEEDHLPELIRSMLSQTHRPLLWVLVDDGSKDRSATLIHEAARQADWIVAVQRSDRGARRAGNGVIEAFYDGYALVAALEWEFVVKLDADLAFAPDYFERCLQRFTQDATLGIGGGTCCTEEAPDRPEFANEPKFHVRGPTKIYRRACFEDIGGLLRSPGWDTVDLLKANMLGWKTRSFEDIRLLHRRHTGDAYGGWSNWCKNGLANYVTGYDPIFMLCKCLKRALSAPFPARLKEAAGLLWGFMRGAFADFPRVDDARLIRYVRDEQWRALCLRRSLWH